MLEILASLRLLIIDITEASVAADSAQRVGPIYSRAFELRATAYRALGSLKQTSDTKDERALLLVVDRLNVCIQRLRSSVETMAKNPEYSGDLFADVFMGLATDLGDGSNK